MKITEEQEELVVNFGALEYDSEMMSNILDTTEEEILKALEDGSSRFTKLYNKGLFMAEYAIDKKLLELSRDGDLKALAKLEERKSKRK